MKYMSCLLALLGGILTSCGQSSQAGSGGTSTSGNTGATAGVGGASSSASHTDSASNGGVVGNGGITGSGGTSASAGGVTANGGSTPKTGAGGNTTAAGGTGGSTTAKATGIGGAAGGTPTSGGAASGGASAGMGGKAVGGASTSAGGSGKGGASTSKGGTGPDATGGAAAGGTSASGTGGSTGGTSAAGSSTCAPPSGSPTATPIQFNDNGGWCWYQDERAVVDTKNNKLVIGSVAVGGSRNGNVEAVIYDLAAASKKLYTISTKLTGSVDDHNAPAFAIRPDGRYVAQYCGHRVDCITRFSTFDGSAWSAERTFDWAPQGCPWAGASTNMVTYSNPWYVGTSIYSMVRSIGTDPAVLTSADDGQSWSFYGRLMSTKQTGYVAGYFKYWGNNTDRIDFVGTEAHPRDFDNSLYHGYIQDGQVYNSAGTRKNSSLKDSSATTSNSVDINTYTPIFKTGASVNGTPLCRMWNHDIVRYADGTVAILGQGRTNNCTSTPSGSDPDKRMIYSRWDGTSWKTTYLVRAGAKLYSSEEDYTGLGALHPDDPHTIFISSTFDPRDDTTKTSKHEIYQGTTCDNGATWTWTPITKNSTVDNVRPVVPKWDANHTALLWMKGTYTSAQNYSMQIVGLVSGSH